MSTDHLATLLRAVALLRPAGALDPALVAALARLVAPAARQAAAKPIALRLPAAAPAAARAEATTPVDPAPVPLTAQVTPSTPVEDAPVSRPRPRPLDPNRLLALPSELLQIAERADLATRQGAAAEAVDAPQPPMETSAKTAPLESLFAPGRVRAILRELSTLVTPSGQPDIAAVVALIARAEPVERLPQRLVSTLGHSVLLLFDAGPSMLPFSRDKQQFAATATRLLGRDRVRVADFIGDPLKAVRAQRQVRWEPMHWPGRQSSVVVVGDLGVGRGTSAAALQADDWARFLDEARRRGLRTVLLIPYGRDRWPAMAHAFGTALTWDGATGVQALRRRMRMDMAA